MRLRYIPFALIALSSACTLAAEMSATEAFSLGRGFGTEANATVPSGITPAEAEAKVPNYAPTSDRSSLYSGMRNIISDGAGQTTYCKTTGYTSSDPKEKLSCDATNLLTDFRLHEPTIAIDKNTDPIFVRKRAIQANPEASSLIINSSTTACTPTTSTSADVTRTETCFDYVGAPTASTCQMPWDVEVVQHNRYQCDQGKPGTRYSCSERLVTTCSMGCYPSGITLTNATGFGTMVITDAGGGYYWFHLGTVLADGSHRNNYWSGTKYRMYEANYTINVSDVNMIDTFLLDNVSYDDSTAIWINGAFVWGNRGGTTLDTCDVTAIDPDTGATYVAFEGATNGIDACTRSSAYWNISGSVISVSVGELKGYLRTGTNTIRIRVLVGTNGDVSYHFKSRYSCGCTKSWVDGCAAYK